MRITVKNEKYRSYTLLYLQEYSLFIERSLTFYELSAISLYKIRQVYTNDSKGR
jgi:hypothetical protein